MRVRVLLVLRSGGVAAAAFSVATTAAGASFHRNLQHRRMAVANAVFLRDAATAHLSVRCCFSLLILLLPFLLYLFLFSGNLLFRGSGGRGHLRSRSGNSSSNSGRSGGSG